MSDDKGNDDNDDNDGTGYRADMERLSELSRVWSDNQAAELSAAILASWGPGLRNLQVANTNAFENLRKSLATIQVPELSFNFEALNALAVRIAAFPALSNAKNYQHLDAPSGPYSTYMKSPRSYFETKEVVVDSFESLNRAISTLIANTPQLPLVWRGVKNASWALHSSLYRHLMIEKGVTPPAQNPFEDQPFPSEEEVVVAERQILRIARSDWRFDNLSALETFARIQHVGGPTRLLDVTKNPYIAAWFAVEFDEEHEHEDSRLFAMATRPVAKSGKPPAPDSTLQLDDFGASRDPFWHLLTTAEARQNLDWGTGARRLLWVPPAYDARISAQNAAFVLDGVPMTSGKTAAYFAKEAGVYWRRADLLASSSIYARMTSPGSKPRYNAPNFAPTFSFLITTDAKGEIRDMMESRFGYRRSYIYPDMQGLADHLRGLRLDGSD